ncbi:hypothetical protein ACU4GD_25830 [Cupriavidus basilensis]
MVAGPIFAVTWHGYRHSQPITCLHWVACFSRSACWTSCMRLPTRKCPTS